MGFWCDLQNVPSICWRSKGVYNEDQALILWTLGFCPQHEFISLAETAKGERRDLAKFKMFEEKRKCFAAKRSPDFLKLKLFDVFPQRQMFDAKSLNLLKCSRVRGPRGEAVVN